MAKRTGIKSYEAASVIHAIADIVAEETLEGSRISLANEDGTKLVSIYPKVSGNRYADILRALNMIREGMVEKKAKMAKIDSGLSQVENWLAKMEENVNP